MAHDLLIKNATVVDGSGAPRKRADVAIKGERIAAVGVPGSAHGAASRVIDAEGLVLCPGFIDLHTHYDPQITWDPWATPSVWHGVTSVLIGNCGLTVAPVRPSDRDYIMGMFSRVEDVHIAALKAGLDWRWQSYPEYMDAIDKELGVNILPMLGMCAARYYVMGQASLERAAKDDEVRQMQRLVHESMEAGAFGWTTNLSPTHVDHNGAPVPTRQAAEQEHYALARAMRGHNAGIVGFIPNRWPWGLSEEDRRTMRTCVQESGRPLLWNPHIYHWNRPDDWKGEQAFMAQAHSDGLPIYTITRCHPLDRIFTLKRTTLFNGIPVWRDLLARPVEERLRAFADPAMRPALRHAIDNPDQDADRGRVSLPLRWEAMTVNRTALPKNKRIEGRFVVDLAREREQHVADVLCALAVDEKLETEFLSKFFLEPDLVPMGEMLKGPYTVPGNSDAGAHLNTGSMAGEVTYFLRNWVLDRNLVSLEEGVRKLTSMPAMIMGLKDRGLVREGMVADLVLFDPQTLRPLHEERVGDLPGNETRIIERVEGVTHVIVNGRVVVEHNRHTGDLPGKVLRSYSYKG